MKHLISLKAHVDHDRKLVVNYQAIRLIKQLVNTDKMFAFELLVASKLTEMAAAVNTLMNVLLGVVDNTNVE